jgi:putative Ig domain-containing protein
MAASGGTAPYYWSVVGVFPPGLTLPVSGTASGTPTSAGTFKFTVQVDDAAGGSATGGASITISRRLSVGAACATLCQVEQLCIDVCGGFGSQSGGTPPYKYSLSGSIPAGTSLNGLSLAGQFTTVGRWSFGVTVTDAWGQSAALKANFSVFAHIALRGGTFGGRPGFAFVLGLPYSGGTPGGTPVVTLLKGTLPAGTTFVVNPKLSQVDVRIPAQKLSGSYSAVFGLTDQSPCSSTSNCRTSATVVINIG